MLFFRKYSAWLEDRCLPVAIVVVYAIKAEILIFFFLNRHTSILANMTIGCMLMETI